jgi:hypothetical protein
MLCAVLLLGLSVAGCSRPAPVRPPTVPDVVEPAWLEAGSLDIRFTATHHDGPTAPRISQIHTVFTIAAGGRVQTMQTAQSTHDIVTSRTTWSGGTAIESAQLPGCGSAVTRVGVPASLAGWLAETFGPVDTATGAGWSISGSTASRPGSAAGTVERAPLTRLPERVTREVTARSGVVVSELANIEIQHIGTAAPTASLPSCGEPTRPGT